MGTEADWGILSQIPVIITGFLPLDRGDIFRSIYLHHHYARIFVNARVNSMTQVGCFQALLNFFYLLIVDSV